MLELETLNKVCHDRFVPINQNTAVLSGNYKEVSRQALAWLLTEKVQKRLQINMAGLNGLATTIVFPSFAESLDNSDLKKIISYSNGVNANISLPQTDDLIIRSSAAPFNNLFSKQRVEMSEPALLAKNVSSSPTFQLLESKQKVSCLQDFLVMVKGSFLMIHDDNYNLQTGGFHGSIYENRHDAELYFRTGSLQARNMGDPELRHPTLRINSRNLDYLFGFNPESLAQKLDNTGLASNLNCVIRTLNCDNETAFSLADSLQKHKEIILSAFKSVRKLFGNRSVAEFRIYQDNPGWVGQKLHILDVDY